MENRKYIDCQSLRNKWGMYDVGGRLYNSDGRDWTSYVDSKKKEYAEKGCGKDVLMEKCLEREAYLTNLRESINAKAQQGNFTFVEGFSKVLSEETQKFSDLGCQKKIEENRQVAVSKSIDKYSELDKERIEAESKYQQRVRIFIGASVLLIALTTIFLLKTKK